jgi:isocitrate dehydrogenase
MSSKGIDQIKAEEAAEKAMAEDILSKYEVQLGLKSPETTPIADTVKSLGPAVENK